MVMIASQQGHFAPERDIVPGPIFLSCSLRWAAFPPLTGTFFSIPKTTLGMVGQASVPVIPLSAMFANSCLWLAA